MFVLSLKKYLLTMFLGVIFFLTILSISFRTPPPTTAAHQRHSLTPHLLYRHDHSDFHLHIDVCEKDGVVKWR